MITEGATVGGRYRLDRLLAHGGMASVFAAHDNVLERDVAIKVLRQAEPVDETRFRRETHVLAGLSHPNLVTVYDAGEDGGDVYLVLELVPGPTLADRLRDGPLDPAAVARLGRQLGGALEHVHDRGVVHRDVKPSNVLFDQDGRARLGDFGIARLADAAALTATAMTIGTAAYMAPEQVEGHVATPAADIYALGLVLLEALTGRRAFPGPSAEAAIARLHRDPEIPTSLPVSWRALLAAMTDRVPERRPDAAAVAAALDAESPDSAAVTAAVAAPTETLPAYATPVERRPRSGTRAALLVAAAAVLAIVIGVALLARGDGESPGATTTSTVTSTTTAPTTAPTTTAPPTTAPPTTAVDCAALEAEKDDLEARGREIRDQYRDDRETRERLLDELDDRKREIDEQLRDHCR